MENDPENPQEEKEKNVALRSIDWVTNMNERILTVCLILGMLSGLIFWISKGKEPELVRKIKNSMMEHKECLQDDVITGEIQVNGRIKKAALCNLTVFNKYEKESKTVIANEITQKDGTFKFSFCRSTTAYVEFSVNDFKHQEYVKGYPVDSIPTIVDFQ